MRRQKIQLTVRGRKLLQLAKRRILRMPETFDMGDWFSHNADIKRLPNQLRGYCGTEACAAGHVVLAAGITPASYFTIEKTDIPAKYQRLFRDDYASLGLNVRRAAVKLLFKRNSQFAGEMALFYTGGWPEEYRAAYGALRLQMLGTRRPAARRKLEKAAAKVAAARIDHLLKTGE